MAKKRGLILLILLIAAVLMGVGYFALSKSNAKKEAENEKEIEDKSIELLTIAQDDIVKMSYNKDKTNFDLVKENDIWYLQDDKDFPLNQSKIDDMASQADGLTAVQIVTENPENLDEYGLLEPCLTVNFKTKDKETSMIIGDKSINGRYMKLSDSDTIYIVETTVYEKFDYVKSDLMQLEELPSINLDYITELSITNRNSDNFKIIKDYEDIPDITGYCNWTLLEPYNTPQVGNSSNITTLLENYTSFSYSGGIEYNCDDLSKYGLDNPVSKIHIDYYEVEEEDKEDEETTNEEVSDNETKQESPKIFKEFNLLIGDMDNSGNNYYVKTQDSNAVYLMNNSNVEKLININSYDNVYNIINSVSIDTVDSIDLIVNGDEKHKLSITREEKEVKNEDINDKTEDETKTEEIAKYYKDNKEIKESDFKELYNKIISITLEGEITDKSLIDKNAKILSVIYNRNTDDKFKKYTIEYYKYNDNFYCVNYNGGINFLVDKRTIDEICQGLINN